ncbi:MAG: carbon-nitrogen hydrolase family protein [Clostridiales bacterium]|nr:carbon-nitrogen hydrolase family protein [Clostridiales bacterium]
MKATVVQPPYFMGENPDEKIAEYLITELEKAREGSIIVLPEYSNAGGISDVEKELKAIPRAKMMLEKASEVAKSKKCYVAINVLENRDGQIKNSTYLFNTKGETAFIYDKIHLPPSEIDLGVQYGAGECVYELDGIRFGFLTCYDVYFNEQIEYLAKMKPDIILVPGYQRGEATDIIRAQTKLIAFRCNAYVLKSSYSMNSDERGGCSMIVAPNGKILKDLGKDIGSITDQIDLSFKHVRSAGFGKDPIRNDEFINIGLRPKIFSK